MPYPLSHKLASIALALGALVMEAPGVAAAPSGSTEVPVVVVGAGLAGLTTAYRLKQAGIESLVLEQSTHVGGRVRSATYPEGVAAEAGLHEFWDTNPALALAKELGLPLSEAGPAYCSLLLGKTLYPFLEDTDAQLVAKILGPADYSRFQAWDRRMTDLFERSRLRPLPADVQALTQASFGQWLERCAELSPRARQMVRTVEFATSADRISALEGVLEWHIYAGDGSKCYAISGGNQRLPEAIANDLGPERVRTGQQVTRIVQAPDGVEVTAQDTGTYAVHRYRARRVVSTVPLFRLNDIQLVPPLSAEVQRGIATQGFGEYFSAHVVVDKAAESFWHQQGQDVSPILTGGPLACVNAHSAEDPKTNAAIVDLIAKADAAHHFNDPALSADQLQHEVTAEIEKLWPGFAPHIRYMTFVKYQPRAIAAWPVGRSRLDALSDAIRRPQGRLYLAGDFTEGTHSDGASWSAVRVVRQICTAERVPLPPKLVPEGLTVPTQDAL